jgi:metal-responsive CopG/Arc/MetJ family transcriptional regulator
MFDPPVQRRGGPRQPRTERIIIRLTPDALAQIDQLAEKEQRTRSDMVRILLNRGLERP